MDKVNKWKNFWVWFGILEALNHFQVFSIVCDLCHQDHWHHQQVNFSIQSDYKGYVCVLILIMAEAILSKIVN